MKVGYQGETHSYSYQASRELFPAAQPVGFATFAAAFAALGEGTVERLVLPIENSTTGSVLPVLDRLAAAPVSILAEHLVEVRHAVLGIPGTPIALIRRVLSHPEALSQAEEQLLARGWDPVPVHDTAGAVRKVVEDGNPAQAALAPEGAAEPHGLAVLETNFVDRGHNTTRFVVLGAGDPQVDPEDDKTSIMFVTAHRPGALALALAELGLRNANLTRIESRPGEQPWTYRFYVDLVHEPGGEGLGRVIDPQPATLDKLQVLGSYKAVVR